MRVTNYLIRLLAVSLVFGAAVASAADTYTIDADHTSVAFSARHMVISNVRGAFDKVEGTIVYDPSNPENCSVEVAIDATSINTRNEKRDDHLRTGDFLDAAEHPSITFKSVNVKRKGDDWTAEGDLTIRGVTKRVELSFRINGPVQNPWGQTVMGIEVATLTIDRQDYGVSWSQKLDSGGLVVSDKVKIDIQLEAKKES